jgi:hypothetical protein
MIEIKKNLNKLKLVVVFNMGSIPIISKMVKKIFTKIITIQNVEAHLCFTKNFKFVEKGTENDISEFEMTHIVDPKRYLTNLLLEKVTVKNLAYYYSELTNFSSTAAEEQVILNFLDNTSGIDIFLKLNFWDNSNYKLEKLNSFVYPLKIEELHSPKVLNEKVEINLKALQPVCLGIMQAIFNQPFIDDENFKIDTIEIHFRFGKKVKVEKISLNWL